MPDTGAPHFIPFADPTDLVRDWPALSEDVAEAVADGLDDAGGLVAVKSAIFTGTQVESGITSGSNFAVTDLTITHEVADPSNKLIISAFMLAAQSTGFAEVGLAVHDGTGLIAVGDADGVRTRVALGGEIAGSGDDLNVTMPSITFVHTPGSGSKTYTVRAIALAGGTVGGTVFINRTERDNDQTRRPRGVSSLVIQEVKV